MPAVRLLKKVPFSFFHASIWKRMWSPLMSRPGWYCDISMSKAHHPSLGVMSPSEERLSTQGEQNCELPLVSMPMAEGSTTFLSIGRP